MRRTHYLSALAICLAAILFIRLTPGFAKHGGLQAIKNKKCGSWWQRRCPGALEAKLSQELEVTRLMLAACSREYDRRAGCCPMSTGVELGCCADGPSIPLNLTVISEQTNSTVMSWTTGMIAALLALLLCCICVEANHDWWRRLLTFASEDVPKGAVDADAHNNREPMFDLAKGFCSYAVVFFHAAVMFANTHGEGTTAIPGWSGVLLLLRLVVIPSLCFCSGAVAKADLTPKRARDIARAFAAYLIFQAIYHLRGSRGALPGPRLPLRLFTTTDMNVVTWYLLAHCCWRVALLFVTQLRAPLATSIVLGSAALAVDLERPYHNVVAFFPFFVAGHQLMRCSRQHPLRRALLSPSHSERRRFCLAFVAVGLALGGFSARGGRTYASVYRTIDTGFECFMGGGGSGSCATLDALWLRLGLYLSAAALLPGFFAVLPRKGAVWRVLSVAGKASIYIYLLHPFVLTCPISFDGVPGGLLHTLLSKASGDISWERPALGDERAVVLWLLLPVAAVVCALCVACPLLERVEYCTDRASGATRRLWVLNVPKLFVEPPTDYLFAS